MSIEAEYRGADVATCEAIWLKRLLKDLTDRQTADIFTKLQQFLGAFGLRHLDVLNLRGRKERSKSDRETESDEEFDVGMAEEDKEGYRRSN